MTPDPSAPTWSNTIIIELGDGLAPDASPPPPRGIGRRWASYLRIVVPIGLVLVLVAAATVAPRPPLTPLVRVPFHPGAFVGVFGSRAIVIDRVAGHAMIRSYRLAGSRGASTRDGGDWSHALDVAGSNYRASVVGGAMIVAGDRTGGGGIGTEAFDERTGTMLWRDRSELFDVDPAGDVILVRPSGSGGLVYTRVDPNTGDTVWQTTVAASCSAQPVEAERTGGVNVLVTACLALTIGDPASVSRLTLHLIDLGTGAHRASRTVTLPVTSDPKHPDYIDLPMPLIFGMHGLILMQSAHKLSAFRATDLAPLWSGREILDSQGMGSCGPDLCLATDTGLTLIDPQTGRTLPGTVPPEQPDHPVPVFELVPSGHSGDIDPITTVPEGLLAEPPAHTKGAVWLAVDPAGSQDASGPALIAPLPDVGNGGCEQFDAYLACGTAHDEMTLWRLPG